MSLSSVPSFASESFDAHMSGRGQSQRGSAVVAKLRPKSGDGQPKRSPATLLLMGASPCTGQPGAVDWVLNWWSSVKLTGSHGGRWTNLRAGRGPPSRTNWATGPSATRDSGRPANNGHARLVPSFGSGESRLHWQLGVCGAFPCWVASPPRHPPEALAPRRCALWRIFTSSPSSQSDPKHAAT